MDTPLREVINDIQARTRYHFLYRDASIAGKDISFAIDRGGLIAALDLAILPHGLFLKVDERRGQVLLLERDESLPAPLPVVTGEVMDDERGTRLPYATVTWQQDGRLRGTAANEAGSFHLRLTPEQIDEKELNVTVSYVGYVPKRVRIDLLESVLYVPVRLAPETRFGPELVVSTAYLQSEVDTAWHHLLRPGIFSPLGESNVLRSLQTLPSVSISSAVSPGLIVRGSRADGFQVLLDGISIYNQNHFFGLFDAFNEDVLQAVGLYYGVTPASLQGPPGGTLSFVTRTGSQAGLRSSVGVSNTALKATAEGPLFGGRGSWLLSGRRSYLNAVDWFNNDEILGLGLDVGRSTSRPGGSSMVLPDRALVPGDASAYFYDVHSKVAYEWAGRQRLMFNVYLGGDHTLYDAERLVERPGSRTPTLQNVETTNDWGNETVGLRFQTPYGSTAYVHTVAGLSRYRSAFSKQDFLYADPLQSLPGMDSSRHVVRPFSNENELLELKLAQHIDFGMLRGGTSSIGFSLHHFDVTYRERSILRNNFRGSLSSLQLDLFARYAHTLFDRLSVDAGLRSHFFSRAQFLGLSPRLWLRLFPEQRLSLGAGFSRNYQFLHRLYLEQGNNADIWVMSTENQPPGSVDHYATGLYVRASPTLLLQAEAYLKTYRNLREHETSAARRQARPASPLLDPWLHDNDATARGLEVLVGKEMGPLLWTNSYTLSKMEIRNDGVNGGRAFAADWDRRHQWTSYLQVSVTPGLLAHVLWAFASGAPNALAQVDASEPARLDSYHRLDAGIQYRRRLGRMVAEARVGAFNLYDRKNAWYRNPVAVVRPTPRGRQIDFANVDVYDLGFQPSFELKLTF